MAVQPQLLSNDEVTRWTRGHVIPFAVWIGGLFAVILAESCLPTDNSFFAAGIYAAKSILCAGLLVGWKPWRYYSAMTMRSLLTGLVAGLLVAVVWIAPETTYVGNGFLNFYHRWFILMPGSYPGYYVPEIFPQLPPAHPSWAFSPAVCGWPLTILKLLGSSCVIAVAEEYFFRGFLYRWLQGAQPWAKSLSAFDLRAFLLTMALFGFEHDRWLAGLAAGFIYGWLANRQGDIKAAVIAHVTTNFALGLYVIHFARYGFW